MSDAVKVGDAVPEFELESHKGGHVSLREFRGKKPVVLYFYPKDDTPGCTAESCAFRDHFEDFADAGAEVIGVSSDSPASHRRFAEKHRLPFTLLSDSGGKVRARFGVPSTMGLLPGRVTYIIDKSGVVQHIFSSQFSPRKHIEESLKILARMR